MTREEAINLLHGIRAENLNLDDLYTKDRYDALSMAIEALSAIEDIKAEIDQLPSYVARFNGGDFAIHIDKEGVLQIINKHMPESED